MKSSGLNLQGEGGGGGGGKLEEERLFKANRSADGMRGRGGVQNLCSFMRGVLHEYRMTTVYMLFYICKNTYVTFICNITLVKQYGALHLYNNYHRRA